MTRTPLPRPTLLPGLVRLWRNRHTLQLGLDPRRAVLVEVTNPGAARLLDLLDGTHSERAILDHAAKIDVAREDARTLIDTLRSAGLVVGAHTLLPTICPSPPGGDSRPRPRRSRFAGPTPRPLRRRSSAAAPRRGSS